MVTGKTITALAAVTAAVLAQDTAAGLVAKRR